jgi:phosphoserine phosphatase
MDTVLVLIASPGSGAIGPSVIAGLGMGSPRWLAPREACELPFPDEPEARAAVAQAVAGLPIDWAVVPAANRRKTLLIADMDSTIIAQECIDELGAAAGVGAEVAAITARAMRGEVDLEQSLKARLQLMRGLPTTALHRIVEGLNFTAGGRTLVQTMKANGAHTVLVSGGFTYFTSRVAEALGFDEHRGNELLFDGGALSGQVREPILGVRAKADALREICSRRGIGPDAAIAAGDGANDIEMLRLAGLGVGFRAKPVVREAADAVIDHADLTALLYLQGYELSDFVTG